MTGRLNVRLNAGRCSPSWPSRSSRICACGAFVMDVGSWFSAHRATQTVADAAALAGAQKLPRRPRTRRRSPGVRRPRTAAGITKIQFSSNTFANDTISTRPSASLPASSPVCSESPPSTSAADATRASLEPRLGEVRGAVRSSTGGSDARRPRRPCFNRSRRSSTWSKVGPGAFKIVNIDGSHGGTGQQSSATGS